MGTSSRSAEQRVDYAWVKITTCDALNKPNMKTTFRLDLPRQPLKLGRRKKATVVLMSEKNGHQSVQGKAGYVPVKRFGPCPPPSRTSVQVSDPE